MAIFYGMNPPFIGGPQNILSRQEDEKLIKNDLLQLILTVPGERVHRRTFGTPLRSFVFEQLTQADLDSLRAEMMAAIEEFEPRVKIEALDVVQTQNANEIKVILVVSMVKDPKRLLTIERLFGAPTA